MTFSLNRRAMLACMASYAALAPRAFAAPAWPAKAVRIIVPFAPGGAADSSARLLADLFAPRLGQSVIVENKPGAAVRSASPPRHRPRMDTPCSWPATAW